MLAPPTQQRHRASSTSLQAAPATLGRRRSASTLPQLQLKLSTADSVPLQTPVLSPVTSTTLSSSPLHTPSEHIPQSDDTEQDKAKSNMLFIVASRLLEWAHVQPAHPTFNWSAPSSRRSSTDEFVLPLSASPSQTTFADISEKQLPATSSRHAWHAWFQGLPPLHGPILFVILLFPVSTALVLLSLSTLPISLSWPRTLSDLAQLGRELHGYSQSGTLPLAHVLAVMSVTAVWKHAWSIPGAVIWNVLAGALFSPAYATVLLTTLTTIGSVFASLLSKPLAPFLTYLFPRALALTRTALAVDDIDPPSSLSPRSPKPSSTTVQQQSAWVRLSVLRLVGVVPWSGINVACGVCGVALADCFLGAFIGSLPWTAVTCQIGDILQTIAISPSPSSAQTVSSVLLSPEIMFKLAFLSILSLAPILGKDKLKGMVAPPSAAPPTAAATTAVVSEDASHARWLWIKEWRDHLRVGSGDRRREREREERARQLEVLVREKADIERFES